ncbi:MAG: hypothetical protein Q9201_005245 [Fulgogasparrea decipioides]
MATSSSLQHYFQLKLESLMNTPIANMAELISSAGSEVSRLLHGLLDAKAQTRLQTIASDDELPDLDELRRMWAQRDATTHTKADNLVAHPVLPPTPAATPQKDRPTTSSCELVALATTPIRGLRPTRGVHPRPLATPPHSHKRIQPSDTEDPFTASSKSSRRSSNSMRKLAPLERVLFQRSSKYQPKRIFKPNRKNEKFNLSTFELIRVHESIMKQVDWKTVTRDVAVNRPAYVYKRAMERAFDDWMEELDAEEMCAE